MRAARRSVWTKRPTSCFRLADWQRPPSPYFGRRSFVGRSISSYVGTWVLSRHDSSAAPQTVQTASPVCGTKNFSSVRLYSAPQLHCTIVAIPGICASDRRFSSPELCHNRTDPLPTRQRFQTKNHLRKLVPRELSLSKRLPGYPVSDLIADIAGGPSGPYGRSARRY